MPNTLSFASPSPASRPLHVLRPEDMPAFLAGAGAPWAAWLSATGFEAGLGEPRLLPGADGSVAGAVAGYGTAMVLSYLVGQKKYPIAYPLKSIGVIAQFNHRDSPILEF